MEPDITVSRVLASVDGVATACQRRIDVLVRGDVPQALLLAVARTGLVRRMVRRGEPADFALVQADGGDEFDDVGWLATAGCVLFDPRRTAPVDVIRRARRAWAEAQPFVLPLEGPDAFSHGIVACSCILRADIPRISAAMPVNLERHDVERVLASFLPVVQEWVVGVDQKSTDGTLAIVERYADVVFRFDIRPWSFAAARNMTLDRCSYPWIFQTEGHEHLSPTALGEMRVVGGLRLPLGVLMVPRHVVIDEKDRDGQVFSFPWCFRNHPALRFSDQNGVHNALEIGAYADAIKSRNVMVRGHESIHTVHRAHPENRTARHVQATEMNRTALEEFAADAKDKDRHARALFYAMQEAARQGKLRDAVRLGIRYLRTRDTFSEQFYEGHITVGEYLISMGDRSKPRAAIRVLRRALGIDLARCEAELLLADAHHMIGDLETARQLYAKAAGVPMPAYSSLFVRRRVYHGMPWIGLAFVLFKMGDYANARNAARTALAFEPDHEKCREIASLVIEGEEAAA